MKKKSYCGFLYLYDEIEGYNIVPEGVISPPSTFFKYYALTEYNVEALTNLYVYAAHPKQFNDPFDCNEKLITFDTWNDVQCLWGDLFEKCKKTHSTLESACEESAQAYWNILYKKLGLLSLVPRCDNYQMWALYAQNNGFCLELDINKFLFLHHGPFPMNYTETIPEPVHIGDVGGHIAMLIQTNVKNDWWKYEDEWRLYIPNPIGFDLKCYGSEYEMNKYNCGDEHDRKFRYPVDALKRVILGPKFFDKLVANPVSLNEMDIACCPDIKSLEFNVLDFLARITEKVEVEIELAHLSDFSHYEFIPIRIIKYTDRKFRITNQ